MTLSTPSSSSASSLEPAPHNCTHRFIYDETIDTLWICTSDLPGEERIDYIGIDSVFNSGGPSVTGKCYRDFFSKAHSLTDSEIVLLQLKSYTALLTSLCIAPYGKETLNHKS